MRSVGLSILKNKGGGMKNKIAIDLLGAVYNITDIERFKEFEELWKAYV